MLDFIWHKLFVEYSTLIRGVGDRCAASRKTFSGVFQSFHCKISGILLIAKPSQQLLPMVVVNDSGYVFTEPVPNGSKWIRTAKLDRIGLLLINGTVLEPVRYWIRWIRTRPVSNWRFHVNTWIGSKRFRVSRSRYGPVQFGAVPMWARVNTSLVPHGLNIWRVWLGWSSWDRLPSGAQNFFFDFHVRDKLNNTRYFNLTLFSNTGLTLLTKLACSPSPSSTSHCTMFSVNCSTAS